MKVLGVRVPFTRQPAQQQKALEPVGSRGSGWYRILESFSGAWQQNVEVNFDSVLSNHADFACRTLIASDIAKMRVKLVQRDQYRIWTEVDNFGYQVLIKPNRYQTRIQFFESWVLSKLQRGNTYVLKQRGGQPDGRDGRGPKNNPTVHADSGIVARATAAVRSTERSTGTGIRLRPGRVE